MNATNLERLTEFLAASGFTAALLSNPWTIAWLTGYAPPNQTGPSPFDGGPALVWWDGAELTAIASDGEAGALRGLGVETRDYAGYTIDVPLDVVERQTAILREVLGGWNGRGATVAVELRFLPAAMAGAVHDALPGATLRPVDGELEPLRAVKTPEEIAKLRAALALCDQSQADVAALLQSGVSEISLWGELKAGLEVQAGCRLPMLADLVAGVRTGDMGGLPGDYVLQEGDPVIADIVPRLDGYWGDICGTHFVGAPSAEMAKIRGIVHDALRRGLDAVRPGVIARDFDAMLRETIQAAGYEPYPHHSGHGIGVSYHEEPRLVPYNDMALARDMIIAIEPGIYLPGVGGVRLENVVMVTQDGCELLTKHLE
jgi:Xaa-Pro aminopeptidase